MIYESTYELRQSLKDAVVVKGDKVEVVDLASLQAQGIDLLARSATFGTDAVKAYARWMIWEIGQALGARPASIHEFYIACGRGEWQDRTVPAMNIRFTAYDTARAALRAAQKTNAGALIFEIARSEMSYCELPPAEYSAMIIAAAIKEGYFHPLFIQGDHFQINAKKFMSGPDAEVSGLRSSSTKRWEWASTTSTSTRRRW